MLQEQQEINQRPANRRLAKKRVQWLIEHSTSHQLLCWVDSFVLRNPLLRQAPKRQAVKKPHIAYIPPFKITYSPNFKHHIRHSFYAAYL